jgi:sucrose-6-phosphate hydrolase SacC (GH32 family)
MDLGGPTTYYAAKSFADTVNDRRIVWAWVRLGEQALEAVDENGEAFLGFHPGGCPRIGSAMTNTNSMAREVTYDPQLQRLIFFPVTEMQALRRSVLGGAPPGTTVVPGEPLALATGAAVLQSELRVSFAMPTQSTRVGVTLLSNKRGGSTKVYIDFHPNPVQSDRALAGQSHWNVTAGVDQSSMLCPNYVRNSPPPSLSNRTTCPVRSHKPLSV